MAEKSLLEKIKELSSYSVDHKAEAEARKANAPKELNAVNHQGIKKGSIKDIDPQYVRDFNARKAAEVKKELELAEMAGDSNIAKKLKGAVPKGALKAIPLVGGIASALASGDASAAVPFLDSAESLGPARDSLEGKFERGEQLSEDEYKKMQEEARKFAIQQLADIQSRNE